jgi:beta-lactam-binding protein with PASTA domain
MNAAFVSGTVIGQHPAWGKTLAPGTAIGLTVSLGPR